MPAYDPGPLAPGTYYITSSSRQGSCSSALAAPYCDGDKRPELKDADSRIYNRWRFELVPGSTDKYCISNAHRRGNGCESYLSIQGCDGSAGVDLWGQAGSTSSSSLCPPGSGAMNTTSRRWLGLMLATTGCQSRLRWQQSCGHVGCNWRQPGLYPVKVTTCHLCDTAELGLPP